MTPSILITRPEESAIRFADMLRQRIGCGPRLIISPLQRIEFGGPLPDLSGVTTLIFTSRNGVEGFARLSARRDFACYAVGEATAAAAQKVGFEPIVGQGSATDLAQRIIADGVTGPYLHARGKHAALDVAQSLRSAGLRAEGAILYQQIAEPFDQGALKVLNGQDPVIAPLFSPRSAQIFFAQEEFRAPLHIVAISKAVATHAPQDRVASIKIATQPAEGAMLDAIVERLSELNRLEGG